MTKTRDDAANKVDALKLDLLLTELRLPTMKDIENIARPLPTGRNRQKRTGKISIRRPSTTIGLRPFCVNGRHFCLSTRDSQLVCRAAVTLIAAKYLRPYFDPQPFQPPTPSQPPRHFQTRPSRCAGRVEATCSLTVLYYGFFCSGPVSLAMP